MRQGHNNKRMRGRNRKGPNPLSRSYESNGPDVKIRGTAIHIAEKYQTLARDAASSGDRVAEQNYLQHAEHYFRIVAAAQAQMPQPQQFQRNDDSDSDDEDDRSYGNDRSRQQNVGPSDPQPYVNGNDMNGHDSGEGESDDHQVVTETGQESAPEQDAQDSRPASSSPRPRRGRGRRSPPPETVASPELAATED